jgi:hypothetical protein
MIAKGLLVRNEQGHEFLLTTESSPLQKGYELVVSQKVRNQWVLVDRTRAPEIREHLMGALLEFFAGLCRALNDSSCLQRNERSGSRKRSKNGQHPRHASDVREVRHVGHQKSSPPH